MGAVFESSSIADRLFRAMKVWIGHYPGGLAQAVIVMCAVFSASSGTVGACEIVVGLMAIPAMLQAKYREGLDLRHDLRWRFARNDHSALGDGRGLCHGRRFADGRRHRGMVIPGLINTALFMIYIYIRCRLRPQDGPALPAEELNVP